MTDAAPGSAIDWEPLEPPAWRAHDIIELDHFEPWMIGRLVEIVFTIENFDRYRWSDPKPWMRRSGRVTGYREPSDGVGTLLVWFEHRDKPFERALQGADSWRLNYVVRVVPLAADPQLSGPEQDRILTRMGKAPAKTTTIIHNPIRQRTERKPRWARSR